MTENNEYSIFMLNIPNILKSSLSKKFEIYLFKIKLGPQNQIKISNQFKSHSAFDVFAYSFMEYPDCANVYDVQLNHGQGERQSHLKRRRDPSHEQINDKTVEFKN